MDDVAAAAKNPKAITDLLQTKYQFKLKGMGMGPICQTVVLGSNLG